jgi:hypothetical protein
MYVISDELGDELRDARDLLAGALGCGERMRLLAERYYLPAQLAAGQATAPLPGRSSPDRQAEPAPAETG